MKSTNKDKIFRNTTIYKEILKLADRDTFVDINESAENAKLILSKEKFVTITKIEENFYYQK